MHVFVAKTHTEIMTIEEAIEVLELHNQWRKGAEIPMESPVRIGMAIDLVVCMAKEAIAAKQPTDIWKQSNEKIQNRTNCRKLLKCL